MLIIVSAWSAAASDIYISSRFLFFLARRHHAPSFLASLLKYPQPSSSPLVESTDSESDDDIPSVIDIRSPQSLLVTAPPAAEQARPSHKPNIPSQVTVSVYDVESIVHSVKPWLVIPVWTVLFSSSIGLLAFTSTQTSAMQVSLSCSSTS